MTGSGASVFSLVMCGLVANAVAGSCDCVDWKTAHENGVPDGAAYEVITRVGTSIYRGLTANMCMLKTTRCVDENWDYSLNTPEDTWCFVDSDCTENEGTIAGTSYAWKTCTSGDADFCSLTPEALVEIGLSSSHYGVTDPTKFVAWACPYSSDDTLNTIAAQSGSIHIDGCGFNSDNAPNVTSEAVDSSGCAHTGIDTVGGIVSIPTLGEPKKAALTQQDKVNVDDVHNAVGEERTRLLRQITSSGATRVVPAGMSGLTVGSPDACAIPHSLYIVGHGMIYFCSKTGPPGCTCEYGCAR